MRNLGDKAKYQRQGLGGYEDEEEYSEVSLDKSDKKP